ncbi:DUF421 domain-containing protein [Nostoc sp. ATCC 53789]|nr:DUF421 domain-containing protein [Nostoc sp. ATCC 53789]
MFGNHRCKFCAGGYFGLISDRSHSFRQIITGNSLILIQDGEIQLNNLKKAHVSQTDLIASLRSNAHLSDPNA